MASTLRTEPALRDVSAALIRAGINDRKVFDQTKLEELAASIAATGLAQRPLVRPMPDGTYQLVQGERRTRAMRDVLGWSVIPVVVEELTDQEASAKMLAENILREDLDPIAEASAYAVRLADFPSVAEAARSLGIPADRMRSRLELLKLCDEAAHLVSRRMLALSWASHLVPLDGNRQRLALAAFSAGPMTLDTWRNLCSRYLADQQQDSIFDTDSFLQVADHRAEAEAASEAARAAAAAPALEDLDLVGVADVAARLGVKAATVAQWKYRGLLPAARWSIGSQPVWIWSEVQEWAAATGRV